MLDALIHQYGVAAIAVLLFLESFGFPVPGETLLVAGAFMAGQGELQLAPLISFAWLAAMAGDNVGYAIGRFGGRRLVLRFGYRIGITGPRLDRVTGFFRRYGGGVVLVARFFAIARQLNGLVAGIVDMRWWRFWLYNAIGAALWVCAWGLGVFFFGREVRELSPWLHRAGVAYIAGVCALVLLLLGWRWYRRRHLGGPSA